MMREMREEDAQNSLVYFTDLRDDKNICGFGIDMGPGLPKNTRRVFYGLRCRDEEQQKTILLDENYPLAFIQKISFADFIIRVSRILDYSCKNGLLISASLIPADLPRDIPLSEIDFRKETAPIEARIQELSVFHATGLLNAIIVELAERGVIEI